jgi:hypothetical protein
VFIIRTRHFYNAYTQTTKHQTAAEVGFQVLTAFSMNTAVFWVLPPCSLEEVYRRFRGACCHHQGDEKTAILIQSACFDVVHLSYKAALANCFNRCLYVNRTESPRTPGFMNNVQEHAIHRKFKLLHLTPWSSVLRERLISRLANQTTPPSV